MFGKIREYFRNSIDRAEADLRLLVAFIVHFVVVFFGELAPTKPEKIDFFANHFASWCVCQEPWCVKSTHAQVDRRSILSAS